MCCFYRLSASLLISSLKYSFYLLGIAEGVWTPSANWIWFTFPSKRGRHGNDMGIIPAQGMESHWFSWWAKQVQGQEVDSVILGIIVCGSHQLRIFYGVWLLSLCFPGGGKSSIENPNCAQNKEITVQVQREGQESPAQLGDEDLSMEELEFPKLTGAVLDITWSSEPWCVPNSSGVLDQSKGCEHKDHPQNCPRISQTA